MGINIKIDDLIYPYFVVKGKNTKQAIKGFPGIFRFSNDKLLGDIKEIKKMGINKILLFGIPETKDAIASSAYKTGNIIALAVKKIKDKFPDLVVITDVCLCAYTSHGHCGILTRQKTIDSRKTLEVLVKIAFSHAQAGADFVAPSAMAVGQVDAIRKFLDKNGYRKTKILAYSAKFASDFYGPFRSACNSGPVFGDRSGYQLDYLDTRRALREIEQDIREGADIAMVKPALSYLDIIYQAKNKFNFRLAVYNVSGEYALIKNGVRLGLFDEKKIVLEILSSMKRAGADLIITYHAKDFAKWQKNNDK